MGAIEPIHILIVLVVILLLFGAKRLPELGKSLGSGIREFKKSTQELRTSLDTNADEAPPTPALNAATPEPGSAAVGTSSADAPAAPHDS